MSNDMTCQPRRSKHCSTQPKHPPLKMPMKYLEIYVYIYIYTYIWIYKYSRYRFPGNENFAQRGYKISTELRSDVHTSHSKADVHVSGAWAAQVTTHRKFTSTAVQSRVESTNHIYGIAEGLRAATSSLSNTSWTMASIDTAKL